MTQPYGQQPDPYGQPGGNNPQSGGFPQQGGYPPPGGNPQPGGYQQQSAYPQQGGYQQQGGYPAAPAYAPGAGGLPQAPPDSYGGSTARPGTATAAAVLAYIQAGITLITTIIGIAGLSQAAAPGDNANATLAWVIMIAQAAGIVLLIWGGVQITQGKSRTILILGCALELAICLFYLINFVAVSTGGIDVVEGAKAFLIAVALFFAIMPAISLFLSLGGGTRQFLQAKRARY